MATSQKLKFAGVIRVERIAKTGTFRLLIDGEEFPYYLDGDGVNVQVDSLNPGVTVTILADRVEVVDDLTGHIHTPDSSPRRSVPSVDPSEVRDALKQRGH